MLDFDRDVLAHRAFLKLAEMGLIDKAPAPAECLREQSWWSIGTAVREYAFRNVDQPSIPRLL